MDKLKQIIIWLLYLFIFLLPFQTRWIFQQGFLNNQKWEYATRSIYATELLLGLILILSVVYFIFNAPKNSWRFTKSKIYRVGLLILLVLFLIFNALSAKNSEIAFDKFILLILGTGLAFVIIVVRPELSKISWAFVLSGFIQSVFALQQFIDQKVFSNKWLGMAEQLPQTLGVPVIEAGAERVLRSFGSFPHPNMLAGFLLLSIVFLIGLYAKSSHRQKKILTLMFLAIFLGLLTTFSRAAFIVFIVVIVFLAYKNRANNAAVKAVTKLAILGALIIIMFTASYPKLMASRVFSFGRVETISNEARINQYSEARGIIKSNWQTGAGLGNYVVNLSQTNPGLSAWQYQPIHNTYLLIFSELGLFGLMAIFLFIFFLASRLRERTAFIESAVTTAALLSLAIIALFDHYLWSFYSGIIFLSVIIAINFRLKTAP